MNFMVIVSFGSTSIVKFPSMSAAVFCYKNNIL